MFADNTSNGIAQANSNGPYERIQCTTIVVNDTQTASATKYTVVMMEHKKENYKVDIKNCPMNFLVM